MRMRGQRLINGLTVFQIGRKSRRGSEDQQLVQADDKEKQACERNYCKMSRLPGWLVSPRQAWSGGSKLVGGQEKKHAHAREHLRHCKIYEKPGPSSLRGCRIRTHRARRTLSQKPPRRTKLNKPRSRLWLSCEKCFQISRALSCRASPAARAPHLDSVHPSLAILTLSSRFFVSRMTSGSTPRAKTELKSPHSLYISCNVVSLVLTIRQSEARCRHAMVKVPKRSMEKALRAESLRSKIHWTIPRVRELPSVVTTMQCACFSLALVKAPLRERGVIRGAYSHDRRN